MITSPLLLSLTTSQFLPFTSPPNGYTAISPELYFLNFFYGLWSYVTYLCNNINAVLPLKVFFSGLAW